MHHENIESILAGYCDTDPLYTPHCRVRRHHCRHHRHRRRQQQQQQHLLLAIHCARLEQHKCSISENSSCTSYSNCAIDKNVGLGR